MQLLFTCPFSSSFSVICVLLSYIPSHQAVVVASQSLRDVCLLPGPCIIPHLLAAALAFSCLYINCNRKWTLWFTIFHSQNLITLRLKMGKKKQEERGVCFSNFKWNNLQKFFGSCSNTGKGSHFINIYLLFIKKSPSLYTINKIICYTLGV